MAALENERNLQIFRKKLLKNLVVSIIFRTFATKLQYKIKSSY